ncbi:Netrin receptor UNC5B [Mizuhopecten yessoensis]|uniref:Netrin receptor UNC5B n=1 Tax=Mizuhopecten yessoensis TaxID=6573 RepID=A0A210QXR1_MIZYE|nr:Netrin receptor UNC5B [Mizuhopecten yessoensis]
MADLGVIAGFIVLGLFLLLVIIAFIVVVFLVIKKLRFQNDEILELNGRIDKLKSVEEGGTGVETDPEVVVSRTRSKPKGEMRTDSAVDMCDSYSLSTNDNSIHGNEHCISQSPVSFKIKPQYTIKVKNRHTLMFGSRTAMPQMVAMTQDFSRDADASDAVATVDEIDIESCDERDTVGTLSPLSRQSIWQGRPTSILMQTPTATPDSSSKSMSQEKGVFVHKSIGKDGDILKMSGLTLEIPPGALNESKLITLGITWDEALLPKLKKKQAHLSPVVVCQPCIRFAKPVKLTFPHCGVQVIRDWIPRVIKRQGNLDDQSEWTNLTLDDYEERDFTESDVTVSLKHFTLYTLVGESKPDKTAAKKVKLIAFTPTLQMGVMFKTRIYCINDYDTEIKVVDKVESKLDGSMSNAPVPLIFHDNGKDLTVSLKTDVQGWNLCGEKTQVNKLTHNGDPRQELHRKLIILLDPKTNSDAGDFRDLASHMDLDGAHVTYLENQPNPTEQLLKQWKDDKKSLHELKKVLSDIHRPDAVEEVELFINKYLTDS